jgi:hypothetical protein
MSDDDDTRPVGFLGRLRNMKAIAWVVIIGLVLVTVGASTILFFIQFGVGGR